MIALGLVVVALAVGLLWALVAPLGAGESAARRGLLVLVLALATAAGFAVLVVVTLVRFARRL